MKYTVTYAVPVYKTKTVHAMSESEALQFAQEQYDPYSEASDWMVNLA